MSPNLLAFFPFLCFSLTLFKFLKFFSSPLGSPGSFGNPSSGDQVCWFCVRTAVVRLRPFSLRPSVYDPFLSPVGFSVGVFLTAKNHAPHHPLLPASPSPCADRIQKWDFCVSLPFGMNPSGFPSLTFFLTAPLVNPDPSFLPESSKLLRSLSLSTAFCRTPP